MSEAPFAPAQEARPTIGPNQAIVLAAMRRIEGEEFVRRSIERTLPQEAFEDLAGYFLRQIADLLDGRSQGPVCPQCGKRNPTPAGEALPDVADRALPCGSDRP